MDTETTIPPDRLIDRIHSAERRYGFYSSVHTFFSSPTLSGILYILHLYIFRPVIFRDTSCQIIDIGAWYPLTARDECRAVAEEFVHILEIEPLGFRLETPEKDSVRQVTYDEHDVEFLGMQNQSSRIYYVRAVEDSPSRLMIWRLVLLGQSWC